MLKFNLLFICISVLNYCIFTGSWWILEIDSHSKLCWKEREMPVPLSWHRAVFCDSTQELIIIGGVCVSPYEMVSSVCIFMIS